MADLSTPPTVTVCDARRSTRISESVRLSISGQSKVGSSFSEVTLTLAVNCHGCIYPSRNEHRSGSWVTLEFPNQQSDPKAPPVRAQVKFVRAPRNPEEPYQVGVELEAPANVWKVQSIPKDWLRFPVLISGAASARDAPADDDIRRLLVSARSSFCDSRTRRAHCREQVFRVQPSGCDFAPTAKARNFAFERSRPNVAS